MIRLTPPKIDKKMMTKFKTDVIWVHLKNFVKKGRMSIQFHKSGNVSTQKVKTEKKTLTKKFEISVLSLKEEKNSEGAIEGKIINGAEK